MRNITSGLFISLDGVVESPHLWQFDVFDEDLSASMMQAINLQDDVLLGRVTYQEWAEYWPNATGDGEYADFINNVPKHVVSTTLDRVDWHHSRLIKRDLAGEVARLKQSPGRDIGVQGSPTLVRSLLREDLLDLLTLIIHPVVVGEGKRLFDDWAELKRMKLIDSQITGSGVALLTYEPRR